MTVDSWAYLLVFVLVDVWSAVGWRHFGQLTHGKWSVPLMRPNLFLPSRSVQRCLICPKQSQEETTVLMPLKIWTLILRVLQGGKGPKKENTKTGDQFCTFDYKNEKKSNKSNISIYSALPPWADKRQILWFSKMCLGELYCF